MVSLGAASNYQTLSLGWLKTYTCFHFYMSRDPLTAAIVCALVPATLPKKLLWG